MRNAIEVLEVVTPIEQHRTAEPPGNAARLVEPFSLVGTRSSHRWAELPGNFDRLNCRAIFASDNEWGIPSLPAAHWSPDRLVAYNSRNDVAKAGTDAAVHFFLDDYRFETVWTKPERGLSRIASVGAALTPDFSLWREMPRVMQLWQVYRSRWCGAWLAANGVRVIPTLGWSTAESYPFAFAGIDAGSIVAVSTVGVVREAQARDLFASGYTEMIRQIAPSLVLTYGKLPEQLAGLAPFKRYETRWR